MLELNHLQAAFVDYGGNKHGFLAYNEIHPIILRSQLLIKKLLEQELEASKTVPIEEDEEDFEDQQINNEKCKSHNNPMSLINKEVSLKSTDFFNYKPLEEFPVQRIRKEKVQTFSKDLKLFFTENIVFRRQLKVIK